MSITKNVLLRKILIFNIENWFWKSNQGTFWQLPITPILKIQSFPLGVLIFKQKSFQFCALHLKSRKPVLLYHTFQPMRPTLTCVNVTPNSFIKFPLLGVKCKYWHQVNVNCVWTIFKFDHQSCCWSRSFTTYLRY